ncbi:MAG: plasmid mobilization protein [Acidobacteriaceae bacterium]
MATHFASPNSARPPHNTPGKMPTLPSEDIGAVLERFHKWAGNHAEPVRELTYEEAVKRSRRRVYDEEEPAPPEPVKAAIPESSPQPATASQPAANGESGTEPAPTSQAKSREKAAAAKPGSSGKKTTSRKVSRKAAAQPSPKKPAAAARKNTDDATAEAISASLVTPSTAVHRAEAEIVPSSAPVPSFEQVLAAHMPMALTPRSISANTHCIPPLPQDAPSVHLTVRLAPEERDALRERAHDLGITPAAYLRHCMLEIDGLRAELEAARLACAQVSVAQCSAELPDAMALKSNSPRGPRQSASLHPPADGSWCRRLLRAMLPGRAEKAHLLQQR